MSQANELKEQLGALLTTVCTLSLSTIDDRRMPHAANLYFAPDNDFNLYFVSDLRSSHSEHVVRESRIAATLYAPVKMWQQIRGIQLRGRCEPIDPGRWSEVWSIYLNKFPHIAEIQDLVRSQQFYQITPDWFRLIDNTIKFGYKVETDWPISSGG